MKRKATNLADRLPAATVRRLVQLAAEIAITTPEKIRNHTTYVERTYVEEIRTALAGGGFDWREALRRCEILRREQLDKRFAANRARREATP